MKQNLYAALFAVFTVAAMLFSCTPTQDDVKAKLVKPWKINKYYVNNEDSTAAFKAKYKNYSLQFFEDMSFVQTAIVNDTFQARYGSWYLNEGLDSLFLESSADTNRFFIRLLRIKNLNIREVKANTSYDYLMVEF